MVFLLVSDQVTKRLFLVHNATLIQKQNETKVIFIADPLMNLRVMCDSLAISICFCA